MSHISQHKTPINNYLLLAAVICIWGFVWPISKFGLTYISPAWFVFLRLLIGVLLMFPLVAIFGKLTWPKKAAWPLIIMIGLFQIGIFMLMLTVGLLYVGAGRSAILVYSTPIWVTPIAYFFFNEHINRYKLLALAFGMIGIFILFSPWGMDWHDKDKIWGNILLILSAMSWAVAMLCARYMKRHASSLEMAPWQLLVALIPVAILTFITDPTPHIVWHANLIWALAFCGILGTAFSYWALFQVGKELSVITMSLALLAVPLISMVSSAFLVNEPLTLNNILAMLAICIGLFFAAWGQKKLSS